MSKFKQNYNFFDNFDNYEKLVDIPSELNGIDNNNSICVKEFYDKMKEKHIGFFSDYLFEEQVHNMNNYNIENMNILFNLYSIKSRINMLGDTETTTEGS
ncbi:PIR Superfamily Protein [Plasmodium ovale curtisi]|uniref:PIR Superfamily Protein n=1 Tax=Plasmodium ovale curtisi TaxID=864141 RepID=A0A1A8WF73_PLAOA|nr:PIR Superfamily Protein [Plasmodium ovale curtisi]